MKSDTKRYKQTDALIQWAYFMEDVKPLHTSSCALFWRSVALTPLKVLGPVAVTGFLLFTIATVILNWLAPQILPTWMVAPPPKPWDSGDTVMLACWLGLFAIVITGTVTGFFGWLHRLCIPVEIEGGLVEKGSCPVCNGYGRMRLSADGTWICQRCKGIFTPAPTISVTFPSGTVVSESI